MCPCDTWDWRAGCLPAVLGSAEVQEGAPIPLCILLTYFNHCSMTVVLMPLFKRSLTLSLTSQCPLCPPAAHSVTSK